MPRAPCLARCGDNKLCKQRSPARIAARNCQLSLLRLMPKRLGLPATRSLFVPFANQSKRQRAFLPEGLAAGESAGLSAAVGVCKSIRQWHTSRCSGLARRGRKGLRLQKPAGRLGPQCSSWWASPPALGPGERWCRSCLLKVQPWGPRRSNQQLLSARQQGSLLRHDNSAQECQV
jgi:hypothetical protein